MLHSCSGLQSILPTGECPLLLLLPLSLSIHLVLCELAADSAGLLDAKINGHVLLLGIGFLQSGTLILVHHSEHTGNRLADYLDLGKLVGGTSSDLGHAEASKLLLKLLELQKSKKENVHQILETESKHTKRTIFRRRSIQNIYTVCPT